MQWCYKQAQHGFLHHRSTLTSLLDVRRYWTLAINDEKCVQVAYIDYARAFDTISHNKRLHKLPADDVTGTLLD